MTVTSVSTTAQRLIRRLAGACSILAFVSPAFAATTPVSTVAQLNTAFAMAQGGDKLALACGTYQMPNLQGRHFSPPLVITSADPTCKAILQGLKLANVTGVTFDGLEMVTYTSAGPVDPYYAFRLGGCAQISFTNDYVHGEPAKVPSQQINAFYPNTCSGLDFESSTFSNLNAGINAQTITGLHVKSNLFTGMAKGAMEIGGSQNIEIVDNLMTDFHTGAGVHGDGVQIFTAGTKVAPSHIVISGNLCTRGGGLPVQCFFLQDEAGNLPFSDVTITDNAALGGEWNSIALIHSTGPNFLSGNISASWAGQDPVKPQNADGTFPLTSFTGYLRVDKAEGTVLEQGDCAQQWIVNGTNAPVPAGNTQCAAVTDGGAALEAAWRASHPAYPAAPAS